MEFFIIYGVFIYYILSFGILYVQVKLREFEQLFVFLNF